MTKAIFLDMDETLCDTTKANLLAKDHLADFVASYFQNKKDAGSFAEMYLKGIYKNLSDELKNRLFPITDEEEFRTKLVHIFFEKSGAVCKLTEEQANNIRKEYDKFRIEKFDFFPGCKELLKTLRSEYTLIVITNGPVYSQKPKVERIALASHVDHIIIGGEEPEEKPFNSIFQKALSLASVKPEEAIHIGDSLNADVVGANNSGIKSVWINPEEKTNDIADFSIKNIIDLPEILDQLKSF